MIHHPSRGWARLKGAVGEMPPRAAGRHARCSSRRTRSPPPRHPSPPGEPVPGAAGRAARGHPVAPPPASSGWPWLHQIGRVPLVRTSPFAISSTLVVQSLPHRDRRYPEHRHPLASSRTICQRARRGDGIDPDPRFVSSSIRGAGAGRRPAWSFLLHPARELCPPALR